MAKDDIRTLASLREELDPQGEAKQKEDLLGETLLVQKIKPWTNSKGKQAVRIIATVESTGELVHFSGGEPMYKGVIDFAAHVPFAAELLKSEMKDGTEFWLLE